MTVARSWVFGLAMLALTGCKEDDTVTAPTAPVDAQVTLAPGGTARIEGTSLTLRFDRVEGDSRCPADAMCIQGGDAVVHVAVVAGDVARPYELHTGSMAPVQHDAYTLTMIELAPYPFSARPIEPGDYRLTVRVTR